MPGPRPMGRLRSRSQLARGRLVARSRSRLDVDPNHPEWAENHAGLERGDFDEHHRMARSRLVARPSSRLGRSAPSGLVQASVRTSDRGRGTHKHAVEAAQAPSRPRPSLIGLGRPRRTPFTGVRRDDEPRLIGKPRNFSRYLSTGYPQEPRARVGVMPAGSGKNLGACPSDVLHSCYKYNYISPSIGWGYTLLHIRSRVGGE